MKNMILSCFLLATFFAYAQDTIVSSAASAQNYEKFKSKRGVYIFPEKGEFAIGISANSFLNYFGNLVNPAGNTAPTFNNAAGSNRQGNPLSAFAGQSYGIFGKYMVNEATAYRARANFGFGTTTNGTLVQKIDPNTPASVPSYAENKTNTSSGSILIGLGIEKRRGKDRVKGLYGGELLLGFSNSTTTYTYANTIDLENATERVISNTNGNQFLVGVRPFVGVEYFFAPKISIGGELAYVAGLGIRSEGIQERERLVNGTTVEKFKSPFGGNRVNAFYFGLDNFDANLNLSFYF